MCETLRALRATGIGPSANLPPEHVLAATIQNPVAWMNERVITHEVVIAHESPFKEQTRQEEEGHAAIGARIED
jgi:hypothetical protein